MKRYDFYSKSQTKNLTKFVILAIFCLIFTTFALLEGRNFYYDEPTVAHILMDSFQSSKASSSQKLLAPNLQQQKELTQNNVFISQELNSQRQARAVSGNNTNSTEPISKFYYEEQTPVVVYSKTDIDPTIAQREMSEITPKQDTDQEYAYEDYDYFGQQEERTQQPPSSASSLQQEQTSQPYYKQTYHPKDSSPLSPDYYDDSRAEAFTDPDSAQQNSEASRSSQYSNKKMNYRQYPYANPSLYSSANNRRLSLSNNADGRFMPFAARIKAQQQRRDPYPAYVDDYNYLPPHTHALANAPQSYGNQQLPEQMPQYRHPQRESSAEEKEETGQQMDLLTMLKYVKTMWDLYRSFTTSWNTIAERRNREEEMAKQKYKQQIRINSRKPPKFNTKKNTTVGNKNAKRQPTTTSTTMKTTPSSLQQYTAYEEEDEEKSPVNKQPMAKVEPRKGNVLNTKEVESLRDKRQAAEGLKESAAVEEGRYIKGDPLKGYYDFVITEGSYKFWAAFQVGTAILIIYSTFAAIYYSKVNPLVSDYDYTDYLGGARSLSGDDVDFVDNDAGRTQGAQSKSWLEWLPRTGHSLKFILDAIDKLPHDHADEESDKESYTKAVSEVGKYAKDSEYLDETEPPEKPKETLQTHENKYLTESELSHDSGQNNKAL